MARQQPQEIAKHLLRRPGRTKADGGIRIRPLVKKVDGSLRVLNLDRTQQRSIQFSLVHLSKADSDACHYANQ